MAPDKASTNVLEYHLHRMFKFAYEALERNVWREQMFMNSLNSLHSYMSGTEAENWKVTLEPLVHRQQWLEIIWVISDRLRTRQLSMPTHEYLSS